MFKKIFILFFAFFVGCVIKPTYAPQTPKIPHLTQVLPPSPATLPLPADITKDGNWAEPFEAGQCSVPPVVTKPCPAKSGILISEEKAARDYLYKISYDELRQLYTSDLKMWQTEQQVYDQTIEQLQKQIEILQPTWFQQNSLMIGFVGGVILSLGGIIVTTQVIK